MKRFEYAVLFSTISLLANAGQIVPYRTDTGSLVLVRSQGEVVPASKPVSLCGAESGAAAIQLYECALRNGIEISHIDVSSQGYLSVRLVNGTHLRISWRDMGKNTALLSQDLSNLLNRVRAILRDSNDIQTPTINATDLPPEKK